MASTVAQLSALLLASLAVLLQTCLYHGDWDEFWLWALVCSTTSSAVAAALCIALGPLDAKGGERVRGRMGVLSLAFAVWWSAGVGILTFVDPFRAASNAYFGAWAALFISWLMSVQHLDRLKQHLGDVLGETMVPFVTLSLASLAVFVQALVKYDGHYQGASLWILLCSLFSVLICAACIVRPFSEICRPHVKAIALFLLVWWAAGAFSATFYGPYYDVAWAANGYFGCWIAFGAAIMFARLAADINLTKIDGVHRSSSLAGGAPIEMLLLFFASLVVLLAAGLGCRGKKDCGVDGVWAMVCSGVSLALSFAVIFCKGTGMATDKVDARLPLLALFLMLWWILGTTTMTFEGPFQVLGNGYFGAWAALAAAVSLGLTSLGLLDKAEKLAISRGTELAVLSVASVLLLLQALFDGLWQENIDVTREWVWALVCGGLSLLITAVEIGAADRLTAEKQRVIAVWLFCLWFAGVVVLTFYRPYTFVGNAFFACWAAFAASASLVCKNFPALAGRGPFTGQTVTVPAPAVIGAPAQSMFA
eukprot:TRINITY_DN103888_c0_g1_i1.p1 TRINITY_DN103888_c0_g1~~TRINITY_DN103888_c0_g1_i1.p1  ORF type:complete len:536 (+),score=75.40 TRINITY_DN103888_c0_g1_i1:153-1760(+)